MKSFTDGLLNCEPAIPGVDNGIIIAPRRLHFTLGVMALEDPTVSSSEKTLENALALLLTLKPRIMKLLDGHGLCIPLTEMNIMKPDRGDADNAHILWFGPSLDKDSADGQRLKTVSGALILVPFHLHLYTVLRGRTCKQDV